VIDNNGAEKPIEKEYSSPNDIWCKTYRDSEK
jgi:hypothetical protein